MAEKSWVAEFMKSVGQNTLNDLIATLDSDIAECNRLLVEAGQGHVLRLEEGEPTASHTRLVLKYGGQETKLVKFFLEFDRSSSGAKILCPYGQRAIKVRPLWHSSSDTTSYEMDERPCSSLSEVSRTILMPVLLYPNYDWSDALKKVEESDARKQSGD